MAHRILLVDDSDLMLRLGSLLLSGDYEVITAGSGGEALAKASAERPDLILMDVNMPVMDGREAAARLKADEKTSAIPVVLVTTINEARRGDGDGDYLIKPFDAFTLHRKVRQYAPGRAEAIQ